MFNVLKTHLHNYALHKTRTQLMQMTDWQLEDVGISRRLLNQGIGSWPWREDASAESTTPSAKMEKKDINKAVLELSRMSDAQLRDIGISRGTIQHSVKHGIDRHTTPKRAA